MGIFWRYELDPDFPFNTFEYLTIGSNDKLHWHDYLEIGLCLEGDGTFIFGKKTFPVIPGDVFIVSNFEHHVAVTKADQTTKYLFIVFLPELIAPSGSRMFDVEYLSPFWYDLETFSNKIDNHTSTANTIGQSMLEIFHLWTGQQKGCRHLVEANLRRILGELIRHYSTTDSAYFTTKIHNRVKLQPVLTYIQEHFRENITLDQVARQLHMSESRFRHFFKEVTNFGFKEYVTYLRINEAKQLLVLTDTKISHMIDSIGYSNAYQFYKLFYRYVAMTPAEYRLFYQTHTATNA